MLSPGASLKAAPGDDFGFDLYVDNEQVFVWVDLSELVDQTEIDQLLEGANLTFELSFRLDQPKRLFGDQTKVESSQSLTINYNLVTKTFTTRLSADSYEHPLSFIGEKELRDYLADSLLFEIAHYQALEADQQYVLKIKAIRLSLSEPIRADEQNNNSGEESLLKAVFRQFLDWTEFGRQEFQSESRPLTASELID